jgi:hypothetical protein
MPAKSEAQQRLFGMALSAKRGKGSYDKKIHELASSMSEKQLHDFAATKHSKLPEKKGEAGNSFAASILLGLQKLAADPTADFNHLYTAKEKPLTDKRLKENKPSVPKDDTFKIPKHRTPTLKIALELLSGGMADELPDSEYDKKELRKGQEHEKEHTTNARLAKEIAKDHLEEHEDYYSKLEKTKIGLARFVL